MAHISTRPIIALLLLAASVFLLNLGGSLLWDDDEPKNATCGREMLQRGDWVVPTFNAELRPHKPVLLYWAMIASYKLVGDSEFGARLPSAIASLGTVLLTFLIGRRLYDSQSAMMAGVLLTAALMFAVLSRAATPDAVLILCTTSAFYCFVRGVSDLRGGHFSQKTHGVTAVSLEATRLPVWTATAMYAAIGLAVLAKGPIGILLPLTVFGCYTVLLSPAISVRNNRETRWQQVWLWLRRQFSPRRLWHIARGVRIAWGIAIVVAVAGPWYLAVSLATDGQWLSGFIGTHNVQRFLHPMEGHSGPIFYYVVAIMAGFFPGSCFLPIAVIHSARDQRQHAPLAPSHAFLWSWILGYLVVFSVAATKLPNYVAPCYPALALLTGGWLISAMRAGTARRFWLRLGMGSFATVGAVLTAGLVYTALHYLDRDLLVALVGLAPLAGGTAALVLLQCGQTRAGLVSFATASVAFTILATSVTGPRVSPHQASPQVGRQLAGLVTDFEGNSPRIATFRFTKPNVVYYLGRPAEHLESDHEAIDFLARDEYGLLVVPQDVYTRLRSQMPADSCVIHVEQQFMKPGEQVFIVGRQPQLALQPQPALMK